MYTQLRLSHVVLNPELALGRLSCGQLCLLSSAQAVGDATITRLIFPVAGADVCDLTRDLFSHGFGHEIVLTGFVVQPEIRYVKLPEPQLQAWSGAPYQRSTAQGAAQRLLGAPEQRPAVFRTKVASLMVSSLACVPSTGRYTAEPVFDFDQVSGSAITYRRATEPRYRELYEGYHQLPRTFLYEPRSQWQAARRRAQFNCARALSALYWSSERLVAPTALKSNHRLEAFLNPAAIAPAYGAFLARNGLCEVGCSPLASYRAHQAFVRGETRA